MTTFIINLIISSSLQLHSSFLYKEIQPLIQKKIIDNRNYKILTKYTPIHTIQMYNIDLHDELAAFKLPIIEKCWLLDQN